MWGGGKSHIVFLDCLKCKKGKTQDAGQRSFKDHSALERLEKDLLEIRGKACSTLLLKAENRKTKMLTIRTILSAGIELIL